MIFENDNSIQIDIIEQNENYIIINYRINDYLLSDYEYDGEIFHQLSIEGEPNHLILEQRVHYYF